MNDKTRTLSTAIAKTIISEKNEPYLEIILHDNNYTGKWYDSLLVLRYKFVYEDYTQLGTFDPTKYNSEYKKVYLYEYEKAYLKPNKAVTELKEYRNHNTCPACSSICITTKFLQSDEPNKMSQLICTCERCQYKWWSKPDYLK